MNPSILGHIMTKNEFGDLMTMLLVMSGIQNLVMLRDQLP